MRLRDCVKGIILVRAYTSGKDTVSKPAHLRLPLKSFKLNVTLLTTQEDKGRGSRDEYGAYNHDGI